MMVGLSNVLHRWLCVVTFVALRLRFGRVWTRGYLVEWLSCLLGFLVRFLVMLDTPFTLFRVCLESCF